MKEQFNIRLPKAIKKLISTDRNNYGQTNDIVAAVAIESFFSQYPPDKRRQFYRAHGTPYARSKN
jgi:hypothetical protein